MLRGLPGHPARLDRFDRVPTLESLMRDSMIRVIDGLLGAIGRAVSLLVPVMIVLIVLEMVLRGGFNRPTPWAHELSGWLLTIFVFLGGPYALIRGKFVRVDVVHGQMSPRTRLLVDTFVSTLLVVVFAGVLFWLGGKFFLTSYGVGEVSATGNWRGPVWAAKLMVPLGSLLLLLGWLSHLLHLWQDAAHSAAGSEARSPAHGAETRVPDGDGERH